MNDQQQSRADALTDEHIATLKLAARAVTPQDIDGAERIESRPDGSYITCPACEGEGCIPFESDYCNYDHVAIGVQFYGVGTEPGAAEAYFRAAKPATILALLDRLERAESALAAPPVEQPAAAPASTNETGAEGLLRRAREELSQVEWEFDPPNRVVALFDDIEAYVSRPPAMAAAAPADERAALPQIPDLVKATAWLTMCLRTELSRLDDDTHKALDEVEAQLSCVRAITNGAIDYEAMVAARAAASPAAEAVAYVCSASNDFAPIVRNKDSAQLLSDVHGDGKIVPLYAAPQPAQADAPAGIDVGVDCLTRVRKLMTRFGIAADESIEGFGASIEDHLNRLVRVTNAFLDKADAPAEARADALALLMELDAWKNAMQGLCREWFATPDAAAAHLRARLHPECHAPAEARVMTAARNLIDIRHKETTRDHEVISAIDALEVAVRSAPADAGEAAPFGWAQPKGGNYFTRNELSAKRIGGLVPVYTAPPAARAASLTDEQRESIEHAARWLARSGLARSEDLQNKAHAKRLRALLNGADHDR
ncbi:hypothetical protein [Burkholderia pseudomallei]|uniref:hypothetical protein n=1 Tax=Burkholderia pseudomallei TaxID=28450 RepID=UPI00052A4F93|nr:hypothetical protein [Burkholderia pseudomallei]AIV66092.1 putative gp43 [Burkholderia pseudomallei K42]